jgi:hypothetical protein
MDLVPKGLAKSASTLDIKSKVAKDSAHLGAFNF